MYLCRVKLDFFYEIQWLTDLVEQFVTANISSKSPLKFPLNLRSLAGLRNYNLSLQSIQFTLTGLHAIMGL